MGIVKMRQVADGIKMICGIPRTQSTNGYFLSEELINKKIITAIIIYRNGGDHVSAAWHNPDDPQDLWWRVSAKGQPFSSTIVYVPEEAKLTDYFAGSGFFYIVIYEE